MSKSEIHVLPDPDALAQEAGRRFIASASAAISASGQFNVVLAGGSTPAGLYRLLAQAPCRDKVDWSRTFVYFGDERCVPPDHPDSNYRMARETLLDHVPLPSANIFRMPGELDPVAAAAIYAAVLRQDFRTHGLGRPRFDLILLGMGADGHTASLFPGMPALGERWRLVTATAVPADVHPAVPRITLTLPVLNAGREVLFLGAGANKAEAVRAVLAGPKPAEPLPARRVRPRTGTLTWLLDEAAAAGLG
ncbi:MAG: 6-phosphogluconolactonase [Anaerolineae bacterium CG2_30_64_16]|nr:MAG: 6-phosphogluconolactonase [Anaerolineae bacterium CG2_30_64_16]